MATQAATSAGPAESAEDAAWDKQLFHLAGLALIGLLAIIVMYFVAVGFMNGSQTSFKKAVQNDILLIQQVLPPAFQAVNRVIGSIEAVGTDVFNAVTFVIIEGSQAALNVILSVGDSVLEVLKISGQFILDLLEQIGNTATTFFENVFTPVVTMVQNIGENITLTLQLLVALYSPILTFINTLLRAIERIGSVF